MKRHISPLVLFWLLVLPYMALAANPDGYYDAVNGKKKAELKAAMHDIIAKHTKINYGDLWEYYEKVLKSLADYGARIVRLDAFKLRRRRSYLVHSIPPVPCAALRCGRGPRDLRAWLWPRWPGRRRPGLPGSTG